MQLNPVTLKKLKRFKSIKRGYYSFIIFSALVIISLLAELLVNSRALAVSYQGELYFPTYGDVIPGQQLAAEMPAAIEAQRLVAREQRGVGQRGRGVDRRGAHVAAAGDDRVQVHAALQTRRAGQAAVEGDAGFAERPGHGVARIEAGRILPTDPVQRPAVGVECEQPHALPPCRARADL